MCAVLGAILHLRLQLGVDDLPILHLLGKQTRNRLIDIQLIHIVRVCRSPFTVLSSGSSSSSRTFDSEAQ